MLDEFIFPISSISFVLWHVERKGWSVTSIPQAMVVTSMRHSVSRPEGLFREGISKVNFCEGISMDFSRNGICCFPTWMFFWYGK